VAPLLVGRLPRDLRSRRRPKASGARLLAVSRSGPQRGLLLACSAIIETFLHRWEDFRPLDLWVPVLEDLVTAGGFPSPEAEMAVVSAMFTALVLRMPDHPRFAEWEQRAWALFETAPIRATV